MGTTHFSSTAQIVHVAEAPSIPIIEGLHSIGHVSEPTLCSLCDMLAFGLCDWSVCAIHFTATRPAEKMFNSTLYYGYSPDHRTLEAGLVLYSSGLLAGRLELIGYHFPSIIRRNHHVIFCKKHPPML